MGRFLHNVFQRIKSRGATRTEYRITWDHKVVRVEWLPLENETGSLPFEWDGVMEVESYKRDLFTIDCICLAFRTQEGWVEVNEDMPGWRGFLGALQDRLPGFPALEEWYGKAMLPAFRTNRATLWTRDKEKSRREPSAIGKATRNAFDNLFASCLAALVMGTPYFVLVGYGVSQVRGPEDNGAAVGAFAFVLLALFGTLCAAIFFGIARLSWPTREKVVREHLFAWPLVVPIVMLTVGILPAAAAGLVAVLCLVGVCLFCAAFGLLAAKLWLKLSYTEWTESN
jgi:hypothetical protein